MSLAMGLAPWVIAVISSAAAIDYEAPPECPDAATFRALVAARLGRDPFAATADVKLEVKLTAGGAGFRATLHLFERGEPLGDRQLENKGPCSEFAQSVALAAALALDPLLEPRADAEPPAAAPVASEPQPAPQPPSPPPARPLGWSISAGLLGALGAAPSPTLGGFVELRLGGERWSVGLEGRARAPGQAAVAEGIARVFGGEAVVSPCLEVSFLALCAPVALGGVRVEGSGLPNASGETLVTGWAGLRAGVMPRLSDRLSVSGFVEAAVPFVRPAIRFGDERVWQMGWVIGSAVLALRVAL